MNAANNGAPSEPPVPDSVKVHPAWFRLIDQRNWYDSKSQHCQRWYKRLKLAQVALAVLIPATSLLPADCAVGRIDCRHFDRRAGDAAQQMNQYSTLWVRLPRLLNASSTSSTCFSNAGPYKGLAEPDRLIALAERVEEHVSTEHANWFNETRRSATAKSESKE